MQNTSTIGASLLVEIVPLPHKAGAHPPFYPGCGHVLITYAKLIRIRASKLSNNNHSHIAQLSFEYYKNSRLKPSIT